MCWTEHVSLNIFLFSTFALGMIFYNNEYTPYKIPEIQGWGYIFLFSFIIMQLNEYFLWKSIQNKDKDANQTFSITGLAIILFQPFAAIQTIPKIYEWYKNILSICYVLGIFSLYFYKIIWDPVTFKTTIGKNHTLYWNWLDFESILETIWFYFLYSVGLITIGIQIPTVFWIGVFWHIFTGLQTTPFGSLWCLLVNTILLYYLLQILFYLPLFTRAIVK